MPRLIVRAGLVKDILRNGLRTLRVPTDAWVLEGTDESAGPMSLCRTCVCAKGWRALWYEVHATVIQVDPSDRGNLPEDCTHVVLITTPRSVPAGGE